jgi:hypothetical protein
MSTIRSLLNRAAALSFVLVETPHNPPLVLLLDLSKAERHPNVYT